MATSLLKKVRTRRIVKHIFHNSIDLGDNSGDQTTYAITQDLPETDAMGNYTGFNTQVITGHTGYTGPNTGYDTPSEMLGRTSASSSLPSPSSTIGTIDPSLMISQGFNGFGAPLGGSSSPPDPSGAPGSFDNPPAIPYIPPSQIYQLPDTSYSDYGSYDYAGDDGGDYGFDAPILLNISGTGTNNGVNITQLSSSNTFFDMTGTGLQHQTAWAGVGNGVLFVDLSGKGQLTQANQMIFTNWDPTAKTDMQALLDVFDTNHNGQLDAGDADFSQFFVMLTNANGTQSAYSLAQLGITSLNLNASHAQTILPDGSSVNGTTTYTKSNGTTGTAATVSLAYDTHGYHATTTITKNSDGSTTVQNATLNTDGSLAGNTLLNTSADGNTKILTTFNAGGQVTHLQTDVTSTSHGVTTQTLTNYANGTVTTAGELTTAGTTGDEILNRTTTITNGDTITINQDTLGGGWTTQSQTNVTHPDGATTSTFQSLAPNGAVITSQITQVSDNGLSRTTTTFLDNNPALSTTQSDLTIIETNTQSLISQQTETIINAVGTSVINQSVTNIQTTANAVTKTTASDLTDGTTLNLTTTQTTTTHANGSTTTSQTDMNADGSLRDASLMQLSADGLSKATSLDTTGLGTAAAPVYDTFINDITIVNADLSRTETIATTSANGTQLSKSITTHAASGPARSTTIYGNSGGAITETENVTVNATTGAVSDVLIALNPDRSIAHETISTTSANGLSKTIQTDMTGALSGGAPVFDHTTNDVTVKNADGSFVETISQYAASTNTLIGKTQITTSANGLTTTTRQAFTSTALTFGTWDRNTVDAKVIRSDGSVTETTTQTDGFGNVLETLVQQTSADRKSVTTTTTWGTTGLVKTVDTQIIQANGSTSHTTAQFDKNGDVTGAGVVTTSADGLTRITQQDIQGQTAAAYAASGLVFDQTTTDTTVVNADGSRTETINVTSQNGTLLASSSVHTSANGLRVTTTQNPYAMAHDATQTTNNTSLNANGSQTAVSTTSSYNGTEIAQTSATTSANGLSKTLTQDLNGDGAVDRTTTDVTTLNANGSQTEIVTDYNGTTSGFVRDVTTTTSGIPVAGIGNETISTRQSNGSVPTYQVETILPASNGSVSDTIQNYATQGGPLLWQTQNTISANGLVKGAYTAVKGDTTWDFWTLDSTTPNADGSTSETIARYNKAGLISETLTTLSANGLVKTTSVDANGAVNTSGGAVFNQVTTDAKGLNGDGSSTETLTNMNNKGAITSKSVTTTSADQQTITISRYLNETGNISTADQTETLQTQPNGSVLDTITNYNAAHALLGTIVKTNSANGLVQTTIYKNALGVATDSQSQTITYDSNGDGGHLTDEEDADVINGVTFKTSLKTQISGNGQTAFTTLVLSGALSSTNVANYSATASTTKTIADSGIATTTIVDKVNGASTATDTATTVTSANGLSTTTSLTLGSNTSPVSVSQNTINLDGSTVQQTTNYDPANLALMLDQTSIGVSADGRTITRVSQSAYDQLNNNGTVYGGPNYNIETDVTTKNADGSTTETRTGTGGFGAPAYTQIVHNFVNADESQTIVLVNEDANGVLTGQMVEDVAANGLSTSYAFDTTGRDSQAQLTTAAANLLKGTALPTTLLGTDILGFKTTTLNADGSTTTLNETAYGNSLSNLRSKTITTISANGLVTTTQIDNDGNGVYEQVDTTTLAPDGSKTDIYRYYGNTSATASTLQGSNTYTTSANGLVSTLVTSIGMTDTRVDLPNANGSYEWSRSLVAGSSAYNFGYANGSSSHMIDANGMDTWSWNDGYGTAATNDIGSITLSVAEEQRNIAIANELFITMLGHPMDDSETQYCGQYIQNNVFNRQQQALDIINSQEYADNFSIYGTAPSGVNLLAGQILPYGYAQVELFAGFDVIAAFENALGRMPTAEELGLFDQYMDTPTNANSANDLATMSVALAQYAADLGTSNARTQNDPNQDLITTAPNWISPAANMFYIFGSGTFTYSGLFMAVEGVKGVVINGSNNIVTALNGSAITLNGYNDAVDNLGGTQSIIASNATIMIENGGIETVTGNNDQISQNGSTSLTLTSGSSGDVIYVAAGTPKTGAAYTSTYSATNASSATITLGVGAKDSVTGSNDVINMNNNASLSTSGNTVNLFANTTTNVMGSNDIISMGINDTTTISGTNDTFIFQPIFGQDVISGFNPSSDVLQLSASDFSTWSALLSHTSQVGTDTIIQLDAKDTITLKNVAVSSLQSSQFHFV